MKKKAARSQHGKIRVSGFYAAAALTSAAIVLAGCAEQKKKAAIPWVTAAQVRPIPPEKAASADNDSEAPELPIPASPTLLVVGQAGPARPRIPSLAATREVPAKPETPQIVPELSVQESSALRRETEQNLKEAERNVAAASGKSLNAVQTDLESKVRSFISDAREAGRAGDWPRARDLAKKAQVLSEELVNSL